MTLQIVKINAAKLAKFHESKAVELETEIESHIRAKDLYLALAEGMEIQRRITGDSDWVTPKSTYEDAVSFMEPNWEFRIKPLREYSLSYNSSDNGNCRLYYVLIHLESQKKEKVCFQKDFKDQPPFLYSCTSDGEPSCKIKVARHTTLGGYPSTQLGYEVNAYFNNGYYISE